MKIATNNSNLNSFINGKDINSKIKFTQDNVVNRFEKSITKGMIKFFLGMVYFATLMFSLFILLT
jgi:hypothetical protein